MLLSRSNIMLGVGALNLNNHIVAHIFKLQLIEWNGTLNEFIFRGDQNNVWGVVEVDIINGIKGSISIVEYGRMVDWSRPTYILKKNMSLWTLKNNDEFLLNLCNSIYSFSLSFTLVFLKDLRISLKKLLLTRLFGKLSQPGSDVYTASAIRFLQAIEHGSWRRIWKNKKTAIKARLYPKQR